MPKFFKYLYCIFIPVMIVEKNCDSKLVGPLGYSKGSRLSGYIVFNVIDKYC